jgi:hypothetical protein
MGIFSSIFGGSTKTNTTQPAWYTGAATNAVNMGKKAGEIGYIPNMGPDVAGFNPMQLQAMQQAGNRFATFNNPGGPATQVDQMPQTDFGGGLHGYSSYGGWQAQVDALEKAYPGIAAQLKTFSKSPFGAVGAPHPPMAGGPGSDPLGGPQVQNPEPPVDPNAPVDPLYGVPPPVGGPGRHGGRGGWQGDPLYGVPPPVGGSGIRTGPRDPTRWAAKHPGQDWATWIAARRANQPKHRVRNLGLGGQDGTNFGGGGWNSQRMAVQ